MPIKIKIVEDWRGAHKLLSMWWAAAVSALLGFLAAHPGFAGMVWAAIPAELRPDIPEWGKWAIASFTAFATFLAVRLVRQPVITKKPASDATPPAPPSQ